MLCQKCGHLEATVHREEIVFRQRIEEHLCPLCAGVGDVPIPARQRVWTDHSIVDVQRLPELAPASEVFAALEGYVTKISAIGVGAFGFLTVATENNSGICLIRSGGTPVVLLVSLENQPEDFRQIVRDFFTRKGTPIYDLLQSTMLSFQSPPGAVSKCLLFYRLTSVPSEVTPLLLELFTTCFKIKDSDRLKVGSSFLAHPKP